MFHVKPVQSALDEALTQDGLCPCALVLESSASRNQVLRPPPVAAEVLWPITDGRPRSDCPYLDMFAVEGRQQGTAASRASFVAIVFDEGAVDKPRTRLIPPPALQGTRRGPRASSGVFGQR